MLDSNLNYKSHEAKVNGCKTEISGEKTNTKNELKISLLCKSPPELAQCHCLSMLVILSICPNRGGVPVSWTRQWGRDDPLRCPSGSPRPLWGQLLPPGLETVACGSLPLSLFPITKPIQPPPCLSLLLHAQPLSLGHFYVPNMWVPCTVIDNMFLFFIFLSTCLTVILRKIQRHPPPFLFLEQIINKWHFKISC